MLRTAARKASALRAAGSESVAFCAPAALRSRWRTLVALGSLVFAWRCALGYRVLVPCATRAGHALRCFAL